MEQAKNWEDVKPITDVNWLGCLLSSNFKRYKLGDIAEIRRIAHFAGCFFVLDVQ